MPENIGIDIDVEGLGIGKIIKPNNKDGWSKAISWVQKIREKTKRDGKTSSSFRRGNYNSKIFVSQVSEVLHHVIAKNEVTCR